MGWLIAALVAAGFYKAAKTAPASGQASTTGTGASASPTTPVAPKQAPAVRALAPLNIFTSPTEIAIAEKQSGENQASQSPAVVSLGTSSQINPLAYASYGFASPQAYNDFVRGT